MAAGQDHERFLRIARVAEALTRRLGRTLEPFQLTVGQYAALDALRSAGQAGLACGEIAQRLVTRDPDITRMLDRLEGRGLVSRSRERPDRRVVRAQLTEAGQQLLRAIDVAIGALHARYLAPLGRRNLTALTDLLESIEAMA